MKKSQIGSLLGHSFNETIEYRITRRMRKDMLYSNYFSYFGEII